MRLGAQCVTLMVEKIKLV